MQLFGKEWTREEILQRVGDISQIAGARSVVLNDGPAKGVAAIEVRTGTGFAFTIVPDRGMDISTAEHCGRSLCWRSATEETSAAFYHPQELEWLRTFYGGLVVTCGLTYAGAPCEDEDEKLGLHGRVSNTPARRVSINSPIPESSMPSPCRSRIMVNRLRSDRR